MKLTRVIFLALAFVIPTATTSFASAADDKPAAGDEAARRQGRRARRARRARRLARSPRKALPRQSKEPRLLGRRQGGRSFLAVPLFRKDPRNAGGFLLPAAILVSAGVRRRGIVIRI